MLRILSSTLLLSSVLWLLTLRWRLRHRPKRVWPRWLVLWGLWALMGWVAMLVHLGIMLSENRHLRALFDTPPTRQERAPLETLK